MEYDIAAMKSEYVGQQFDKVDFDVDGETMAEYASACGETAPHYTDVAAPDFRMREVKSGPSSSLWRSSAR